MFILPKPSPIKKNAEALIGNLRLVWHVPYDHGILFADKREGYFLSLHMHRCSYRSVPIYTANLRNNSTSSAPLSQQQEKTFSLAPPIFPAQSIASGVSSSSQVAK